MKRMMQITLGMAVAAGLTLCAAVGGNAQGRSQAPRVQHTPMSHPMGNAKATNPSNPTPPERKGSDSFKGVATRLGTTPDALQSQYEAAKATNPKLTRGQFVAANMIAHNERSKNPAVTTQAILNGLQSGKSIGQTLQGLGMNQKDAEAAERQGRRDAAAAQRESN